MDIKTQDLRIGNYIYWNHKGKSNDNYLCTHIVKSINELDVWTESGFVKINKINKIQITKEWLIKFCFEENKFELQLKINDFLIFYSKSFDIVMMTSKNDLGGYNHIKPIKYVHELQNLYFAITGKELIYESKKV